MKKTIQKSNFDTMQELATLTNTYAMLKNAGCSIPTLQKVEALIETTLTRVQ